MKKQNREPRSHYINNGVKALDLSTLPRCQAIATSTGENCKRAAIKGHKFCGIHSGRYTPGAKVNNLNALTHGLYTAKAKDTRSRFKKTLDFITWAAENFDF